MSKRDRDHECAAKAIRAWVAEYGARASGRPGKAARPGRVAPLAGPPRMLILEPDELWIVSWALYFGFLSGRLDAAQASTLRGVMLRVSALVIEAGG